MQLGVLKNKGRRVRIQTCNLCPHPWWILHVACSEKYLYCALKMHETVKYYFNRYFITTEYRADFLGMYSLGWLSGLAVTGPHWRATKTLHIYTFHSRLEIASNLSIKEKFCPILGEKLKTIHRLSKQALSIHEKKNCILWFVFKFFLKIRNLKFRVFLVFYPFECQGHIYAS